jgi:hypothetical protein
VGGNGAGNCAGRKTFQYKAGAFTLLKRDDEAKAVVEYTVGYIQTICSPAVRWRGLRAENDWTKRGNKKPLRASNDSMSPSSKRSRGAGDLLKARGEKEARNRGCKCGSKLNLNSLGWILTRYEATSLKFRYLLL